MSAAFLKGIVGFYVVTVIITTNGQVPRKLNPVLRVSLKVLENGIIDLHYIVVYQ